MDLFIDLSNAAAEHRSESIQEDLGTPKKVQEQSNLP
jgi:hypothetical protein